MYTLLVVVVGYNQRVGIVKEPRYEPGAQQIGFGEQIGQAQIVGSYNYPWPLR
jgi:hypothetical protein